MRTRYHARSASTKPLNVIANSNVVTPYDWRSAERLLQFRYNLLRKQLQEAFLVRSGSMEHKMAEAKIDIRFYALDHLVGVVADNPALCGAFDRIRPLLLTIGD